MVALSWCVQLLVYWKHTVWSQCLPTKPVPVLALCFSGSEPVLRFSAGSFHTAQSPTGAAAAASWRHSLRRWFSPQRRSQQQRAGDCVGSMIVLLLIIQSQIKLNNDFSTLYFSPECRGSLFINVFQRHLPTAAELTALPREFILPLATG